VTGQGAGTAVGGRETLGGLHLAWVTGADLPDGDDWLTPAERGVCDGLVVEKRRTDWLLGRLAAKRAVLDSLGELAWPDLGEATAAALAQAEWSTAGDSRILALVEVLAAEDGRPQTRLRDVDLGPPVSISHSAGVGYAAAGGGADGADGSGSGFGGAVGCDIEAVAPRSDAFVADYFTDPERAAVAAAAEGLRPLLANLIWSAKESALKALGVGLRADTRSVVVETDRLDLGASGWSPVQVRTSAGALLTGHWRNGNGLVWSVLTGAGPAMP
jgi:4'-phosphopantetheinyl transferase